MVDNIKGSQGVPKEWKSINGASNDKEYNQLLDKKINSILKGKETISLQQLKKNSLFANMSDKALERFNYIAGIDGDASTFNSEEVEATDKEVKGMIKNLVSSNARIRTKAVDVSKYDRTKNISEKIGSDDVNEVMLGLSDELPSGYTDKKTGKNISILQAVIMFEDFKLHNRNLDYEECQKAFYKETGVKIEDFDRYRGMGGDTYKIGDWKYDIPERLGEEQEYDAKILLNEKTGEKIKLSYTKSWRNSTSHTVPATNGIMFYLKEYKNNDGTSIKFNYDNDENVAPTSAEVKTNGNKKTVQYDSMFFIDPGLYNFRQH